jgi:hypothetical protein
MTTQYQRDFKNVVLTKIDASGAQLYAWGPSETDGIWLCGATRTEGASVGDRGTLIYQPDHPTNLYMFRKRR